MDKIFDSLMKIVSNSPENPVLEKLRKQADKIVATEKSKLLLLGKIDEDKDGDSVSSDEEDEEEEEEDKLSVGENEDQKEVAMNLGKKLLTLFEYSTIRDKIIIAIGLLATVVHGASLPVLALLFGEIIDAFIASTFEKNGGLEHGFTVSNKTTSGVGAMALGFLNKIQEKAPSSVNISTEDIESSGGIFGNSSFSLLTNGTLSHDQLASYISNFSIYYFYIGISVFIASFLQTACWECAAENQLYRVKRQFIFQMFRQQMSWFDKNSPGSIVLKLADDSERYREGIGHKFSMVIEYISIFIFGALIGFIKNSKLTMLFLGSTPFIGTKILLLWKSIASKSAKQQKAYEKAGKISSETFTAIRGVAAFGEELNEFERYDRALEKCEKAGRRKDLFVGIGIGGMYLLIYGFYAIALWYGVNLLAQRAISPGTLYTIFFGLTLSTFSLGSILPFVTSISTAFGSMMSLKKVLDSIPEIDYYSFTGQAPKNAYGDIKIKDLHFSYPSRKDFKIFDGLNMEIRRDQSVAIVGPSNCGKTTLANLLLRLYDPDEGSIKFDSIEIKKLNITWLRRNVSVVPQNPIFLGGTILDAIRGLNVKAPLKHVIKISKVVCAHEFISKLPLAYGTRFAQSISGKEFSTGERQRIEIARALLSNPTVLILDQCMSAIDIQMAQKIGDNIRKLRKGKTTIYLSSRAGVARDLDYIFVLNHGKMIEKGVHDELIAQNGLYRQMLDDEDLVESLKKEIRKDEGGESSAESDYEREQVVRAIDSKDDRGQGQRSKLAVFKEEKSPSSKDVERNDKDDVKDIKYPTVMMILEFVNDKKIFMALGILGCALSGCLIPSLAIILGELLNDFSNPETDILARGLLWTMVLASLSIIAAAGYFLRAVFINYVGEKLTRRLRHKSYSGILRQPISWFDKEGRGPAVLYARLATDIPIIKIALGNRLGIALSSYVSSLVTLIIAFVYAWQLSLITLICFPIVGFSLWLQVRVHSRGYLKIDKIRGGIVKWANRVIKNIWSNQSLVKAFRTCELFEKMLIPALVEGQKQAFVYALSFAFSESILFFVFGGCFGLGAELLRQNIIRPADLFTVFFALTLVTLSTGQIASFVPELIKARISAASIFELIDLESSVDPLDSHGLKPEIQGEIEFKNVVFSYPLIPHLKILNGLNLTIPKGSKIGIVGTVGGGKSTILKILERFYDIEAGEVLIDGIDIRDINLAHLRSNLGFVSQEPNIFDRTIADNISYGYKGNAKGDDLKKLVEQAAIAADADWILELPNNYTEKCGEQGKNINAGQKQEIAIARAIIREPKILILDDPTSTLDSAEEARVQEAMHKAEEGRTSIIVSNSYSAIKNCDLIAVLVKGKIAEFGKQDDLIKAHGFYYNFVIQQGAKLNETV